MSRRFSLHILLPIEGYEGDKIYESEDISLKMMNPNKKPDDVYYRRLKEKSVYASFDDIVKFACQKYLLGEIHNFSMHTDYFGDCEIEYEGNKYIIGDELVPDDFAIVDDELIQKASALVGYESEKDFANGLATVIENSSDGEDKFIASLILAKEIASRMNGRAVLMYDW